MRPNDAILWSRASELVERALGLHFPRERWEELKRGLGQAAAELGYADAAQCVAGLLDSPPAPAQLRVLATHLTVGETYFFRDRATFETLRATLREVIEARRGREQRLRIWSAGCCTGEEPYSLAMLLREMLPDLAQWHVTITATDINPVFLGKAAVGVYGPWSFRGVPDTAKARHFRPLEAGRHAVRPEVKRMVRFAVLNLVEDRYPSVISDTNAMDLVVCRNVLMYFTPAHRQRAVAKLCRALLPQGTLVVGPNEGLPGRLDGFTTAVRPGCVTVRGEAALESAAAPVFEAAAAPAPAVPLSRRENPAPAAGAAPQAGPAASAPSFGERARECANAGALHRALEWCDRWVGAEKMNPDAHFLTAAVLLELGNVALARSALQRVLYLHPSHVLAHVTLGNISRAEGADAEARRHFANALRELEHFATDEVIPDSDGLTTGRLARTLAALQPGEQVA